MINSLLTGITGAEQESEESTEDSIDGVNSSQENLNGEDEGDYGELPDLDGLSDEELKAVIAELRDERNIAQDRVEQLKEENNELESEIIEKDARLTDLEGSLAELEGVITANAEGDLTRRADIDSDIDSVVALVGCYDRMLDEWNSTLKQMKEFSSNVDESTSDVSDTIKTVGEQSKEVSGSVNEIADGAREQTEDLEGIQQEMRSLSATIEEMAASASEVADRTNRSVERGDAAQDAASDAIDDLEEMETRTDEMVSQVEELNKLMGDIEEITDFITDVAEQTNMLALNANIEAARAGDAGEGFAVVAEEVKKLATDTKEATAEITETVETVNSKAETTVSDMYDTQDAVQQTQDAVADAIDGLDEVVEMAKDVNTSMQEIDSAVDEQAEVTQKVVGMTEDIGDVSERTASAAETVSEAAENQTDALTDVSDKVENLSNQANELGKTSDEFVTGSRQEHVVEKGDTVIDFWHAMGGKKALLLSDLAREFEEMHNGIHFKLSSMGSYDGVLNQSLTADETPALAQINEIGSMQARQSEQFKPASNVIPQDVVSSLVDSVRNYYTVDGELQSIPFNSSNPVLCINADMFRDAGLDPESPPETLDDVRRVSERLVSSGASDYGITFANYSWFVEQWFAEAGQELVNNGNGRNGVPTELNLNTAVGNELFDWWCSIEADELYLNTGIKARGSAKEAFNNERAGMLIGSTSSLGGIEDSVNFDLGTGRLPVIDERNGVLVGGASLWISNDLEQDTERILREFLTWLLEPEQQARWHRETGYFPVSEGAITLLQNEGWFDENPHFATAFDQFQESSDTPATNGAQMGPFPKVRSIIEDGRNGLADVEHVEATLERIDEQVTAELQKWTSKH